MAGDVHELHQSIRDRLQGGGGAFEALRSSQIISPPRVIVGQPRRCLARVIFGQVVPYLSDFAYITLDWSAVHRVEVTTFFDSTDHRPSRLLAVTNVDLVY